MKKILQIENSSFYKRVIARIIIIRIKDFITLIRRYNNKYITDISLKKNIKKHVNTLSDLYDEFLIKQRNKLSGHIQDIDLLERINLWLDIDYEKSDFFIINILEIYHFLKSEQNYIDIDLNPSIKDDFLDGFIKLNTKMNIEDFPRMSTDILSLTRYNNGGLIPTCAIQDKIATLMGLNIIIEYEIEVVKMSDKYRNINDIFKIILVLDIISFLDNLFTRNIQANAPQKMDGLDKIIRNNNYDNANNIIIKFSNIFNHENNFKSYRNIRNEICGHIDMDKDINTIQNDLKNINLNELLFKYSKIKNVFIAACDSEFYLKTWIIPPVKLRGIIGMSQQPDKAFDKNSIPQINFDPSIKDINNEKIYRCKLELLLKYDNISDDIYDFFYEAFSSSEIINKIKYNDKYIELRKAHIFFLEHLNSDLDIQNKLTLLQIINKCKHGYPSQLEYILENTFLNNNEDNLMIMNYLYQFGEICSINNSNVFDEIISRLSNPIFMIRYQSLLSLLKLDIRNNGIKCINSKKVPQENIYSNAIKNTFNYNNNFEKFVVSILLSSEMLFNHIISTYYKYFKSIYFQFFNKIFKESIIEINNEYNLNLSDDDFELLYSHKENNFLTSIILFIAEKYENIHDNNKPCFLYEIISNNLLKINYNFDLFINHLAYSKYKLKEYEQAEKIYFNLIDKNPEELEYYINLLYFYSDLNMKEKFISVKNMLDCFNIDNDIKKTINELENNFK